MSVFIDLKVEKVVQVGDKTRLDATRSFSVKNQAEISLVEIEPEASAGFIDVTGLGSKEWYLDWAYSTDGVKTVTVRVTTDGSPITLSKTISVLTEAEDALLSTDQDILSLEADIYDYLPEGRSSFIYMHRKAQELILEYLDRMGYVSNDGAKLTKASLVSKEEFRAWSKYMVLKLIFFDVSNQPNDHFDLKSQYYRGLEDEAKKRVRLPIDLDGNGTIEETEQIRFDSIALRVR